MSVQHCREANLGNRTAGYVVKTYINLMYNDTPRSKTQAGASEMNRENTYL